MITQMPIPIMVNPPTTVATSGFKKRYSEVPISIERRVPVPLIRAMIRLEEKECKFL
jgi:hypothetical protein